MQFTPLAEWRYPRIASRNAGSPWGSPVANISLLSSTSVIFVIFLHVLKGKLSRSTPRGEKSTGIPSSLCRWLTVSRHFPRIHSKNGAFSPVLLPRVHQFLDTRHKVSFTRHRFQYILPTWLFVRHLRRAPADLQMLREQTGRRKTGGDFKFPFLISSLIYS